MGQESYLDVDGCAQLLGLKARQIRRAVRAGEFAGAAGTDAGGPYWLPDDVRRWAAARSPELAAAVPVNLWPAASEPAPFLGATRWTVRSGDDDVLLRWSARCGTVGMLWRPDRHAYLPAPAALLADADVAVLVEIGGDFGIYGPALWVRNRATPEVQYEIEWPELAHVLGGPLPFWPYTLRDPDLIEAWQPGDDTVTAPATPDLDTSALLRMAANFDAQHPTHRTLLAFAQEVQERATQVAITDDEVIRERAELTAQHGHHWPAMGTLHPIQLAARPLERDAPYIDLDDLDPTVARIGWSELLDRSDTLSWTCVRLALKWDGGKFFPFSNPEQVDPTTPAGAEWRARLEPATDRPAVFAQITAPDEDTVGFRDPLTGAPAVLDEHRGTVFTCIPQRLPSHHPLAEIILDTGAMVWVRTADGALYPAPKDHYYGLNWGYSGSGPGSLALLIDRLLDDITAHAADNVSGAAPGLHELTSLRWPAGTVLDRAVLEAARDGRPYPRPDPRPDGD